LTTSSSNSQLTFLETQNAKGELELFPALWQVMEAMVSSDVEQRGAALETLKDLSAVRFSRLVAYVVATRINEPNLALRGTVLELLSEALSADEQGRMAADEVRAMLRTTLGSLSYDQVLALLEIAQYRQDLKTEIARVLNQCSLAGETLTEILNDRHQPLPLREQAAVFIGEVGFVAAQSAIERLVQRLQARQSNQQEMSFVVGGKSEEDVLIPVLQDILQRLEQPA
jgi:hypothetical protein